MTTIDKSFTAVGSGIGLSVRHNQKFTYSVSGTFSATVVLEKSTDGGLSWHSVSSFTDAASGTLNAFERDSGAASYRFRCSAFTSGTVVTALADVAPVLSEVVNNEGDVLLRVKADGIESLVRPTQKLMIPAGGLAKVGGTAGWVVAAAGNTSLVTVPASQTASTLVIPIVGLKVGQKITAFSLVGQIESGGQSVTLDADLRKHTAAAADVADASVGAITQISVTADALLSSANAAKSSLSEVVGEDEFFYVLVTATTGTASDIALQGVVVTVTEA